VRQGGKTIAAISIGINGDSDVQMGGQSVNMHIESKSDAFVDVADGMPIGLNSVIKTTSTIGSVKITQTNKQILTRI
jgi:hypothetical protein